MIMTVSRKPWSPSKDSRVRSRHLVDGKPTNENPYPILNTCCPEGDSSVKRNLSGGSTRPTKRLKTNEGTVLVKTTLSMPCMLICFCPILFYFLFSIFSIN